MRGNDTALSILLISQLYVCSSEVSFLDFAGDSPVGLSMLMPFPVVKMFPSTSDQWLLISGEHGAGTGRQVFSFENVCP